MDTDECGTGGDGGVNGKRGLMRCVCLGKLDRRSRNCMYVCFQSRIMQNKPDIMSFYLFKLRAHGGDDAYNLRIDLPLAILLKSPC